MALSRVDVTLAYPMLAIGYVINAFAAQYFLNEPVSLQRWVAIGVIVLGVALLARS
ncbi:MAG: EamA family transporter, partial [Gammaproteobacteria bacterium]